MPEAMVPAFSLEPLRASGIAETGALAARIWREHFTALLGKEQVDYMLRGRYGEKDLGRYVGAPDRWFEVLRVDGVAAGFLRCMRASAATLKIEEIYVERERRGTGLGHAMLGHAEARALALGCREATLFVNRRNEVAVQAYLRHGFTIREEVRIDIGKGFVMDDYLMGKDLAART
jgi:GNAT superfamily N-acetyltransferase